MMIKNYFDEHLPKRIILGIVVCLVFSFFPLIFLNFWYKYMDTTPYISVVQPISVDKKAYKPCDNVILTTKLTAKINVNVSSLEQLVLIKTDGTSFRVGKALSANVPIMSLGEHVVSGSLPLPCDLTDGAYFWQGNATYKVYDYERTFSFISETFGVYGNGLSPDVEEQLRKATSSARANPGIIFSPSVDLTMTPSPQPNSKNETTINNSSTYNTYPQQPTPVQNGNVIDDLLKPFKLELGKGLKGL